MKTTESILKAVATKFCRHGVNIYGFQLNDILAIGIYSKENLTVLQLVERRSKLSELMEISMMLMDRLNDWRYCGKICHNQIQNKYVINGVSAKSIQRM